MIAAEGEQKASKALKEAADVLQQSPSALQVQIQIENKCKSKMKVAVKLGWMDENSLSVDMHLIIAYKDRDKTQKIL